MPSPLLPEFSVVHIHYFRPPDRSQLFVQELLHEDGEVSVTLARKVSLPIPVRIDGEVVLEEGSDAVWFTFPGAWHDIGRFHLADGRFTGIYANILTPCTFEPGGIWRTTDLFLDLWIPAGTEDISLRDEEELTEAEERGWVAPETAGRAREEARRLIEAFGRGEWPPKVVNAWPRERAMGRL